MEQFERLGKHLNNSTVDAALALEMVGRIKDPHIQKIMKKRIKKNGGDVSWAEAKNLDWGKIFVEVYDAQIMEIENQKLVDLAIKRHEKVAGKKYEEGGFFERLLNAL